MIVGLGSERPIEELTRGLPTTQDAISYARQLHDGQRRQVDGAQFIEHPLEVASLLYHAGAPDDVIAAGALHDTLEKTSATEADLTARFGAPVAALVRAVTEDARITSYAKRKAALRDQVANAGRDALLVFAADKVSKVRELSLASAVGVVHDPRPLTHYRRCLRLLQERLPRAPLVSALQAELDSLPRAAPATGLLP